jgi:hypothetical protein
MIPEVGPCKVLHASGPLCGIETSRDKQKKSPLVKAGLNYFLGGE